MKKLTIKVDPGQTPQRLDQFLSQKVNQLSRTRAQELIDAGLVVKDGKPLTKASYKIEPETTLEITMPTRTEVKLVPQDIALDIIFENQDVLVLNKPAGLVVHPAFGNWDGTLANAVLHHFIENSNSKEPKDKEKKARIIPKPGIVHRLDKNTSGLIAVAKSDRAKAKLQAQFKNRTVKKTYLALLEGKLQPKKGTIEAPIGRDRKDRKKMAVVKNGRSATTSYEVMQYYAGKEEGEILTFVKVKLHTGRTHQIRVHFASIGYPVFGDETYGHADDILARQFLHAFSLTLKLPGESSEQTFEAPLTQDLINYLQQLEQAA